MEGLDNYQQLIRDLNQQITYSLPTYLVSFPRSGSNFLQFIVSKSTGLHCHSIYGRNIDLPENTLSIKSHSISYKYLLDEIDRLLPSVAHPTKLILLMRDPRDVVISFYEYTQATKNIQINQDEFINNYDFFLAAPIDKECKRKIEYAPISVGQAYKKHLNQWFLNTFPKKSESLIIRYENLLFHPNKEFEKIFNFLGLKCSMAEQYLNMKVSLYSNESRNRGQAYGWKMYYKKYESLIETTNLLLEKELNSFGY